MKNIILLIFIIHAFSLIASGTEKDLSQLIPNSCIGHNTTSDSSYELEKNEKNTMIDNFYTLYEFYNFHTVNGVLYLYGRFYGHPLVAKKRQQTFVLQINNNSEALLYLNYNKTNWFDIKNGSYKTLWTSKTSIPMTIYALNCKYY